MAGVAAGTASVAAPSPMAERTGGFVRGALPIVAAAGLGLLMYYWLGPTLGGFPTSVLRQIGIAIIMAVSLNIVNGFTGQFSMGHAGFLAIGGYVAAFVTYYGGMIQWDSPAAHGGFLGAGEWLLVFGCLLGGCVAAGLGYLVGLPSLRLRGDYLAIVTLGFGEIVRVFLQRTGKQLFFRADLGTPTFKIWPPPLGGAQGFKELPTYSNLFWIWFFVAITVVCAFRLKASSTGRALLSIREDEIAARAMGIDIAKYKVRAFVIAAFFAGIGGGLFAHSGNNLTPANAGFQLSFEYIIMVVLGGLGSISGAVLAAIVLGMLPELLRKPDELAQLWPWGLGILLVGLAVHYALKTRRGPVRLLAMFAIVAGGVTLTLGVLGLLAKEFELDLSKYRMVLYALMLILVMIFRPKGLFGVHEVWELFRAANKKPVGPAKGAGA